MFKYDATSSNTISYLITYLLHCITAVMSRQKSKSFNVSLNKKLSYANWVHH